MILCSSNVHSRILVFYIYIVTVQDNYLIFLKKIGQVSPPKASGWDELEAQPVLMWGEGAEAFSGSASRHTSPGSPIMSRRATDSRQLRASPCPGVRTLRGELELLLRDTFLTLLPRGCSGRDSWNRNGAWTTSITFTSQPA